MSTLLLVRHAQASFFERDYDKLSEVGTAQARRLGEYWLRHAVRFDAVHAGPRARHLRTAELVGQCYAQAGQAWPPAVVRPELDEHEVDRLLLPERLDQVVRDHPQLRSLTEAFTQSRERDDYSRSFQKLFAALTHLWTGGELATNDLASWRDYRTGVRAGLEAMTRGQHGKRVVAFVSVGTMAATLQFVLQCSDATAVELGWRLRNSSLTEIVFSGERFTLDSFNALPHLDDRALWTYR